MQTGKNLQKKTPPSQLTENDWRHLLSRLGSIHVEQLYLDVRLNATKVADASFRIAFDGVSQKYIAEYKSAWDERTFQSAIDKAVSYANDISGSETVLPLIGLPYLSEERIVELERRKISGIDLCGNGLIIAPGKFYLRATGKPNHFRIEQAIQNPYTGKAALVGRTLMRKPAYPKLEDLRQEILRRGGDISLAMVSRTIQALESENIVTPYWNNKIYLHNPSRLQSKLIEAYRSDKTVFLWRGQIAEPMSVFLPALFRNAARVKERCIVTGLSSASRYVSLGQTSPLTIHADTAEEILHGLEVKAGQRFVDLEVHSPPNDYVFFDGERDENEVVWASPVQSMMETGKSEESRLQGASTNIRNLIMDTLIDSRNKLIGEI